MKNLFLCAAILQASLISAEMVYDPIRNLLYTNSQAFGVNQAEYFKLVQWREKHRDQVKRNIQVMGIGCDVSRHADAQIFNYLRNIGSATALALISDLQKGVIIYPDGTHCSSVQLSDKVLARMQYGKSVNENAHALLIPIQ